jgi:hypothetical protein
MCLRAREQHGAARPLILAVAVVVILAVAGTTVALGSSAPAWASGDASAQNLATAAANAAESVAKANRSYADTGLLPLHKHSALPIAPSSRSAWVSAASGGSNSFSVTATAEPSGDTYMLVVSSTGAVIRSCTVTPASAAVTGCQHASSSGNGSW